MGNAAGIRGSPITVQQTPRPNDDNITGSNSSNSNVSSKSNENTKRTNSTKTGDTHNSTSPNRKDDETNNNVPEKDKTAKQTNGNGPAQDPHDILRFAHLWTDRLPQLHKEIEEELELSDEHIDHAQALLRQQFTDVGGFLSVSALSATQSCHLIKPGAPFIQIFHIPERHHWICVSNILCNDTKNKLIIYDSLLKKEPRASPELQEKLAALMDCSSDITVEWVDTKRQRNGTDCGVYAIAAATALCQGKIPENCDWKSLEARQHICQCFTEKKMSGFPIHNDNRKPSPSLKSTIKIYCSCNLPVHGKGHFSCDSCKKPYHKKCVDKPIDKEFVCERCKKSDKTNTNSTLGGI